MNNPENSNPSSSRNSASHKNGSKDGKSDKNAPSSKSIPSGSSAPPSPKRSPIIHRVTDGINHLASHVSSHRVNDVIFNKPMPRQEWINGKFIQHNEKNDEAWVELFIDLIYVVLLSSLAHLLEIGEMSARLYFKVAITFWIVCLTRQAIDEYSNRFYCHDVVQKYIYFIYTIAVFVQASAIQFDYLYQVKTGGGHGSGHESTTDDASYHYEESTHRHLQQFEVNSESSTEAISNIYGHNKLFSSGFAFSVLITRICLLFMYGIVMYYHTAARKQFQFDVGRWSATSILMIVLIILNSTNYHSDIVDFIFFILVVAIELLTWVISRTMFRKYFVFPVNLEMLQLRWGVWVMIVIGESVIQLLQSFQSLDRIYNLLTFIGVSLLLLFSLAMQYFDACQVEWYEHALTKSAFAGVSWIWLHVPMTLQLFRLEVWLKEIALLEVQNEHLKPAAAHVFCISLGVVSLIITAIRMCNSLPDTSVSFVDSLLSSELRSVLVYTFRVIVSIIQIAVGFCGVWQPLTLLVIECCLTLVTTVIDIINDIMAAAGRSKEADAKRQSHVLIKSLKHFPRQWSRLQLVRKESLLEMNLVSEDGFQCHNLLSSNIHGHSSGGPGNGDSASHHSRSQSRSHDDVEDPAGSSDAGEHSVVNIDFKKLIESEVLHSARGSSTHYDGLLLRKQSSMGSLIRGPSLRIVPMNLPTLTERSEGRLDVDDSASLGAKSESKPESNDVVLFKPHTFVRGLSQLPATEEPQRPKLQAILSVSSRGNSENNFANSFSSSKGLNKDWIETPKTRHTEGHMMQSIVRNYSAEVPEEEDIV